MYAIVDIAGQQFKVEKDQKLFVHRLEGEEGKKVAFDRVLLIDSGSKVSVGDPVIKGASVSATILSHVKGDKVLVFKKKRRKGYQKLNGHRQYLTQIQIAAISEKGAVKPKTEETEPVKKESAPKKAAAPKKEAAAKKETSPKKAATPKKETTAKKEAAPKKAAAPKKESAALKKESTAKKKEAAPKKAATPKKETTAKKEAAPKKAAAKISDDKE
ncbi:MAG: 50S ribosomal protein L21 [Bacteroidetes bacterium]|nr:MAG: 50S ribosomal protein L21 [Bacteroidota bacterium]